ncbi:hypothetical protein Fcan01_10213 [Folsomia candida]|uniref:Uncharacterized protein n=1 Tax=Folsomia candida TaxID=158441 RepID=A0A226EED0_FOLCA|nr:hypothetical protein Fcan01_10213 [Folsomia candida]
MDHVTGFTAGLIASISLVYIAIAPIDYLIAFLKASTLTKWLNNWNEIEDDMQQMGFTRDKIEIQKFMKYVIPFFEFAPILVFGSIETFLTFDVKYPIHCVLVIIYNYLPHMCYASGESQALIMLKCLQVEFGEVIL